MRERLYRMITRLSNVALFALYQTTIALGLLLLPLAVAMKRVGVSIPVHRLLMRVERSYEARTATDTVGHNSGNPQ